VVALLKITRHLPADVLWFVIVALWPTRVVANVSVICGGIEVSPGDIVVGDLDGVVVVPRGTAGQVLKMAQEIDQRELEQARRIVQACSLKERLAKYGRI
jgi:regulator of RNase E activity RraA